MILDLTVVAIDFGTHELTKLAIDQTLSCINPKEILVVSDKNIYPGTTWIPCKPVKNYLMYNEMMLKWIYPLVDTKHCLYIQYDGVPINKSLWTDDFLKYDYIGAPWPHLPEGMNVGNGGFSLRSKKLLDACRDPAIQITDGNRWLANEDHAICVNGRKLLEHKYQIKFATTKVARQFSYETGTFFGPTFGIHGLHNLLGAVQYYKDILDKLNYSNWREETWLNVLVTLVSTSRIEGLKIVLDKLIENSPEYVPNIVKEAKNHIHKLPDLHIILDRLK